MGVAKFNSEQGGWSIQLSIFSLSVGDPLRHHPGTWGGGASTAPSPSTCCAQASTSSACEANRLSRPSGAAPLPGSDDGGYCPGTQDGKPGG